MGGDNRKTTIYKQDIYKINSPEGRAKVEDWVSGL